MQAARDLATSTRRACLSCVLLLVLAGTGRTLAGDLPPPAAGSVVLERVLGAPLPVNRNLLTNAGFETAAPPGTIPEGWIWDRRNTDATCVTVANVAHSGRRSIRLTNGTPFGAHVYAMFWSARVTKKASACVITYKRR